MFTFLLKLPEELQLPIIQKLTPTSFTRLRRSCKRLDKFCESERKRIAIRSKDRSTIYMTSSLVELKQCRGKFMFEENFEEDKESQGIFVLTNYGKKRWDSNLQFELTRENIPLIRKAISGFYFQKVSLRSFSEGPNEENFIQALPLFAKVISEIKPSSLLCDLWNVDQVLEMSSGWNLNRVVLCGRVDPNKVVNTPMIQNCTNLAFTNAIRIEDVSKIVDLMRGKREVLLYIKDEAKGKGTLQCVLQKWRAGTISFEEVELDLYVDNPYQPLCDWTNLLNQPGSFHLGTHKIQSPESWDLDPLGIRVDYWLFHLDSGEYLLIRGEVKPRINGATFNMKPLTDFGEVAETAADVFRRTPLDLSSLFEQLEVTESPQGVQELVERTFPVYMEQFFDLTENLRIFFEGAGLFDDEAEEFDDDDDWDDEEDIDEDFDF